MIEFKTLNLEIPPSDGDVTREIHQTIHFNEKPIRTIDVALKGFETDVKYFFSINYHLIDLAVNIENNRKEAVVVAKIRMRDQQRNHSKLFKGKLTVLVIADLEE